MRHLTTTKNKQDFKTFILLHRQIYNLTHKYTNKMNIFLNIVKLCLLIKNIKASPRTYASNLASLSETLHKKDTTTYNISQNFRYTSIEKLPPLAYIPSDLKSFHNQFTHSWNTYANNKNNLTMYPSANVNPTCNSFTHRVFYWSPLQWTTIEDNSLPEADFQMIHLTALSYTRVIIAQTNLPMITFTLFQDSLQETFLFMSKILSYFYEKYSHISFKLTQQKNPTIPISTINCSIGVNELPAIQEVIKPQGESRIRLVNPCILQQIVRVQKPTSNTYRVTFPTSKIRNIKQFTQLYLETTTRERTLTFQWPYVDKTAFNLEIRTSRRRKHLPRIWWLLPHTNSSLTYHENLFAPPTAATRTTTYSYTLNNRHYYNKEGCINHCKHKALQETVQRYNLPTISWPLPETRTKGLKPLRLYCLPQCGIIEHHMNIYDKQLPHWWPHSDYDKCTSNYTNSIKLDVIIQNTYPLPLNLKPLSRNTIYTYETDIPITFSGPLQTYQHELSYLRNHLQKKIRKFIRLWQYTYPQYTKLQAAITDNLLLQDESLIHISELLYYTKNALDYHHNKHKYNTAIYSANDKINEFRHNYYQLNPRFKQLQIYAEQIYSLKQITTVLQAIQNRTDLQNNVIYSHKVQNGYLHNTPIMRIVPSQLQPSQITLQQNSYTERTNEQQTTYSDNGPTTNNPMDNNSRQTSQIVLSSIKPTPNTKPLQNSHTMQRTKLLNSRQTTSPLALFKTTYIPTTFKSRQTTNNPTNPTSREITHNSPNPTFRKITYNPTNPTSRETTSQIVLFSTRPTFYTKPLQDSHTMQITKAQLHTSLPYQTIKTLLTNIMEAFMHLINQSHFLYNAVHIAISSRLQRTIEMLTELCKAT